MSSRWLPRLSRSTLSAFSSCCFAASLAAFCALSTAWSAAPCKASLTSPCPPILIFGILIFGNLIPNASALCRPKKEPSLAVPTWTNCPETATKVARTPDVMSFFLSIVKTPILCQKTFFFSFMYFNKLGLLR